MKTGVNSRWGCLAGVLLLAGGVWARPLPDPRLPALAKVLEIDSSGTTWRESGEVVGGFAIACRDFESCLAGQGWHLERRIPVCQGVRHAIIQQWRRGNSQVLVMLWDIGLGRTGFAWGTEIGKKEQGRLQKKSGRP